MATPLGVISRASSPTGASDNPSPPCPRRGAKNYRSSTVQIKPVKINAHEEYEWTVSIAGLNEKKIELSKESEKIYQRYAEGAEMLEFFIGQS